MNRILKAFIYSIEGLRAAFRNEAAFRQEVVLAAIMIPFAVLSSVTATQKALLVFSVMLVLVVELINSAIEAVVDRISKEKHELSKIAKDVGSAAVLVSLVNVAAIWGLVFFG